MSADAGLVQRKAGRDHALRLAFGGSLALLWGVALGASVPGIGAALAVQLLAASPGGLPPKVSLLLLLVTTCAALLAHCVTLVFIDQPLLLVISLTLLLWHGFRAAEAGRGLVGTMAVNMGVIVPVMTVQSSLFGGLVVGTLVGEVVRGLASVYLMHALLPAPSGSRQRGRQAPPPAPPWLAPAKVAVLLPVLLFYLVAFNAMSFAALTALAAFLLAGGGAAGGQYLTRNLVGNIAGCIAASIATIMLPILGATSGLVLLTLLFALAFAGRVSRYGPVAVMALVTFLAMFGMTLSPVLDLPPVVERVLEIGVLSLYALGAASLMRPGSRLTTA